MPRGAVSPWTQQIEAAERWPQGTGLGLRGGLWGGRWAPPGGENTSVPGVPNTRRSEGMRGARAGRPHKQEGDTEATLSPLGESCPLTLGPDL